MRASKRFPDLTDYTTATERKTTVARNATQKRYLQHLWHSSQVVAIGPPGTGKTFLAARIAAQKFQDNKVKRIVLTRPMVATEELGHLPGELDEKYGPWVYPLLEPIEEYLGSGPFNYAIKPDVKQIELLPLAFMRGRSLDNSFIIFDEAQNATYEQVKMFLTRQGVNSTVVMTGDLSQTDLRERSGLDHVVRLIRSSPTLLEKVPIVEFDREDIVRSPETALWHEAFEYYEAQQLR